MIRKKFILYLLCLFIATCLVGCLKQEISGTAQNITKNIALDDAKSVLVSVFLTAGSLHIDSGSEQLMEGQFSDYSAKHAPQIEYSKNNDRGKLIVEQSANSPIFLNNKKRCDWRLKFNSEKPMDMHVFLGSGDSEMHLSDMKLGILELVTGAGNLNLDMTGQWKKNVKVYLTGGLGSSTILLPKNVGVIIDVKNGLGKVYSKGLQVHGSSYVNDVYGQSDTVINMKITKGSGAIHLEVEK